VRDEGRVRGPGENYRGCERGEPGEAARRVWEGEARGNIGERGGELEGRARYRGAGRGVGE